jgi:hypothetical protein
VYGEREADALTQELSQRLTQAFAAQGLKIGAGAGAWSVSVTLDDAKPNRPTLRQRRDTPGLDFARSFGVGGAKLSATLARPDGTVVGTVMRAFYDPDIDQAATKSTWHDARRAIRQFADEVAQAARSATDGG